VSSEKAKDLVNPIDRIIGKNEVQVEEMYKKTHGNFAPGEQKDRQYQWDIDVIKHRFGYGEKTQINGAATSLHQERPNSSYFPKTVIVKKTVEDVKGT